MADRINDFDFLFGTWKGANRRLTSPLSGEDEWEEFPGELACRPIFGGAGNIEEVAFPTKASLGSPSDSSTQSGSSGPSIG